MFRGIGNNPIWYWGEYHTTTTDGRTSGRTDLQIRRHAECAQSPSVVGVARLGRWVLGIVSGVFYFIFLVQFISISFLLLFFLFVVILFVVISFAMYYILVLKSMMRTSGDPWLVGLHPNPSGHGRYVLQYSTLRSV